MYAVVDCSEVTDKKVYFGSCLVSRRGVIVRFREKRTVPDAEPLADPTEAWDAIGWELGSGCSASKPCDSASLWAATNNKRDKINEQERNLLTGFFTESRT